MTTIEWTDVTWNPTTGCDRVSPGCDHCYALALAKRLKAMGAVKYQRDGDSKTSGPGFGLSVHDDVLTAPLTWRKPRRVFVNSMSDLFHKEVPDWFIARVFVVMAATPQHTYQILTKRHARLRSLLSDPRFTDSMMAEARVMYYEEVRSLPGDLGFRYPLPNVWLGVSVEDQHWADIRIPALMGTPAEIRFLSCEPLLGPIDLTRFALPDWVIVGGESGRNARQIDPSWVRDLRDQCTNPYAGPAGITAFFFKQWGGIRPKTGGRELDGRTWDQYPDDIPGEADMICGPCQAGDHSNHRPELGSICVGCPCDFDGALEEQTDRHQPQTLDLAQPCGCPLGQGHVCRPPWVETHLWPNPPEGPATPTKRSTSLRPPKLGWPT